jgi:AAA+ ATPase superfamily predicted ATPase
MFVGRKRELSLLKQLLSKNSASLVVIKGRRRIGKSRLITEFGQSFRMIALSGLPPTSGVGPNEQRDEVSRQISRCIGGPHLRFDDWSDLFWHLAKQSEQGRVLILLDEISWMAADDDTFLGKLKNAWDLYFKKNPQLILVLCSSVSAWIEKNIISSTGFMGRISLTITLQELTLSECNEFWGSLKNKISSYEKFKCLSVTGGIPNYLEQLQPKLSAEENIKRLCFIKEGVLYNEFNQIFTDLFGKRSELYQKILNTLISKPMSEMKDIFEILNIEKSGVYSGYLYDLIEAGFVSRHYSWEIKTGRKLKISQYRIKDNYIRFYLKYISPNQEKIERDAYVDRSISTLPGWDVIMGIQFENMVLNNRAALHKLLHISPDEIVNDNPYFQRKTSSNSACQIDYLIQTRFNCLYICEIKFSREPVGVEVVKEVEEKIDAMNIPPHFSYRPVLIHVNGVQDSVIGSEFFAQIVDFGELFEDR